jgi:hypothetical protein
MKDNSLLYIVLAFLIGIGAFFVVAQVIQLNSQNSMLMAQVRELSSFQARGNDSAVVKELFALRNENAALKADLSECRSKAGRPAVIESVKTPPAPEAAVTDCVKPKAADAVIWGNRGYLIKDGVSTYKSIPAKKIK